MRWQALSGFDECRSRLLARVGLKGLVYSSHCCLLVYVIVRKHDGTNKDLTYQSRTLRIDPLRKGSPLQGILCHASLLRHQNNAMYKLRNGSAGMSFVLQCECFDRGVRTFDSFSHISFPTTGSSDDVIVLFVSIGEWCVVIGIHFLS